MDTLTNNIRLIYNQYIKERRAKPMTKLYYLSENLEKLMKDFKITEEELLKIGNLSMAEVAEYYYKNEIFTKKMFEKKLKEQIKEVRCFKIDTIK